MKFHLNTRKHFFTVRVTKHWHRLPSEVVESASLEILKSHLDVVLGSKGVGEDDLQSSFHPQPFCEAVIKRLFQ